MLVYKPHLWILDHYLCLNFREHFLFIFLICCFNMYFKRNLKDCTVMIIEKCRVFAFFCFLNVVVIVGLHIAYGDAIPVFLVCLFICWNKSYQKCIVTVAKFVTLYIEFHLSKLLSIWYLLSYALVLFTSWRDSPEQ